MRTDQVPKSGPLTEGTTSRVGVDSAAGDARLVEQARLGDRSAFGALVQRYERRLLSVLLRFVRNVELARDLSQEAFLRAYERFEQFDPSRRFGPWLIRIGVNLALDYLRKNRRRGWFGLFSERSHERSMDPARPDPRQSLDLEEEVRLVLDQIPEVYRTVIVLRDLENFSTSEIAAITQRKEATIRWRLAEGRAKFHRLWLRRMGDPTANPLPICEELDTIGPNERAGESDE